MQLSPHIEQLAQKLGTGPDREPSKPNGGVLPLTDKARRHLEALSRPPAERAEARFRTRDMRQTVAYEDAWKVFARYMRQREYEITANTGKVFSWSFDDGMKRKIAAILRYFVNDPAGPLDLRKGLLVYGLPGTGKTEVMAAVEFVAKSLDLGKAFEWTNLSMAYTSAKGDLHHDAIGPNLTRDRLFDEFMRHSGPVNPRNVDINEAIIEFRHDRWTRHGQLTHFISNMDMKGIEASGLTKMAFDRVNQMTTGVLFHGQSKRS